MDEDSRDADLLAQLSVDIEPPDRSVAEQVTEQWHQTAGDGLGRLEDVAAWWSSCRGRFGAPPPQRPVLVVFAANQGVAQARGVSSLDPDAARRMAVGIDKAETAAGAVARRTNARIRVIDIGLGDEPGTGSTTLNAAPPQGDAMSAAQLIASVRRGAALADEEIDGGCDLMVVTTFGAGATTVAAAVIGLLAPSEAVDVTGRSRGIDDATWMRKCAAVRDAMRHGRPHKGSPSNLLAAIGGPDIAALTALLLRAAQRRTPVLLGGVGAAAGALLAHRLSYRASDWWQAAQTSSEPAQAAAFERLDKRPLLDLRFGVDDGAGALLAVPVVTCAAAVLADAAATG